LNEHQTRPATRAVEAAAPRRREWRAVLLQVHLWIGVALCLPFVMLGVTGSVLVFEHELDALFSHRPAAAAGEAAPAGAIVAAARAAAGRELVPSFFIPPAEPGEPASVRFVRPGRAGPPGAGMQVLVDPVTLEATPRDPGAGLLRQVMRLHANLLMPGRTGRQVIGWFGVAMLVLGVSGLVLWWPRRGRWAAAFVVKRGAGRLRFLRDLHGAVGIWTLAVFIVVTFSGVFLAFPQSTGAVITTFFPGRDLRATIFSARVEPVAGAERISVDRAIELARAEIPAGRLYSVAFPVQPQLPYRVGFVPEGQAAGGPLAWVLVDPWAARVLDVLDPKNYSAGETIMAWQHGLHEGAGLGWTWRILVFISGFLPPLFVITGIWMWLVKRRARRTIAARYVEAPLAETAD
jgi:uncharacterized iron-regulated membrane protein